MQQALQEVAHVLVGLGRLVDVDVLSDGLAAAGVARPAVADAA